MLRNVIPANARPVIPVEILSNERVVLAAAFNLEVLGFHLAGL